MAFCVRILHHLVSGLERAFEPQHESELDVVQRPRQPDERHLLVLGVLVTDPGLHDPVPVHGLILFDAPRSELSRSFRETRVSGTYLHGNEICGNYLDISGVGTDHLAPFGVVGTRTSLGAFGPFPTTVVRSAAVT